MRIQIYFLLAFSMWPCVSIAQNSLSNKQTLVIATCQYGDNPRIQNIEPFAKNL